MQTQSQVIDVLNALLAGELMARDQYFIHSRMYEDWGLTKLYERIGHEMEDETLHADRLIRRILFLGGSPGMIPAHPLRIGNTVLTMLENDLALEYEVITALRKAIAVVETAGDYVTRELLEQMLDDTENDHAHWLEQQLKLIKLMGEQNYIQSQR
ncbi:bacterioferritin [Chitinivorax tropicus]|uniref:Bacterioferritin n=1 Tax=Chitinivorax tropicus TaxID=714531 RepID=A0A840MPP5_9PROT|nr:bacterioferritin [Chitinivorax tropicus]MBB5018153.1 bacterioferritin [Chitinivorax tropicus]